MIYIGKTIAEKHSIIQNYCTSNNIKKVVVLTPPKLGIGLVGGIESIETVKYEDIIMYKYFYRLLQEIDGQCLIVVNECMRTQNRHDLT
jgi:hypothetical protein